MITEISQEEFFAHFPAPEFSGHVDGSWVGEVERRMLVALIGRFQSQHVLELGAREGGTAQFLLSNCMSITKYTGIDVPPGFTPTLSIQKTEGVNEPGFRVRDKRFNLILLRNGTKELTREMVDPVDFVFIDADHSKDCVLHDSKLAYSLIKSGGVVAWHDYGVQIVEVTEALKRLGDEGWGITLVIGTTICFWVKPFNLQNGETGSVVDSTITPGMCSPCKWEDAAYHLEKGPELTRFNSQTARCKNICESSYLPTANELSAMDRLGIFKKFEVFNFRRYSQHYEDGILAKIFQQIGTTNKVFLEIGVGAGVENNTRFLAELGWGGIWIDAEPLQHQPLGVQFVYGWITAENVIDLISCYHDFIPDGEFDLLSLDIDGNDFWVLRKMVARRERPLRPRVICLEYNGCIPPEPPQTIKYDPNFQWNGSNYYGASLSAFFTLLCSPDQFFGADYRLVGCDPTGTNAFFIRSELVVASAAKTPSEAWIPIFLQYKQDSRKWVLINDL